MKDMFHHPSCCKEILLVWRKFHRSGVDMQDAGLIPQFVMARASVDNSPGEIPRFIAGFMRACTVCSFFATYQTPVFELCVDDL